jgi:hypothetical protein
MPGPTQTDDPNVTDDPNATDDPSATEHPTPTDDPVQTDDPSPTATPSPSPTQPVPAIGGLPVAGGGPADGGSTPGGHDDPKATLSGGSGRSTVGPLDAVLREPAAIVQGLVDTVVRSVAGTVRPEAVAAVAEAFTFPLILMIAVLLFLIGQSRMDDPKFRLAPLSKADTTVAFQEEARI